MSTAILRMLGAAYVPVSAMPHSFVDPNRLDDGGLLLVEN